MRRLLFVLLFTLSSLVGSSAVAETYCGFLLSQVERIDAEAAPLVKGIYNLLAREFRALEVRAKEKEEDIDVVEEFNTGPALRGDVVSAARLSAVSLSDIGGAWAPVAYGIQDRRVSENALVLEKSERVQVLERLIELARRVSLVRKTGGPTGVEFAKVYRGKEAIAEYVRHTPLQMREALNRSAEDLDEESENSSNVSSFTGVNIGLAGFKIVPVSQTHSRMTFWIQPFSDKDDGHDMVLPNWLVAPAGGLFGVWVFPGEVGVNMAEQITGIAAKVNRYLSEFVSYVDVPTAFNYSPQMIYSAGAVVGPMAYHLVGVLKQKLAGVTGGRSLQIPVGSPRVVLQPAHAQHMAVVKLLIDVARGKSQVGAGNLVHWGTNYSFKDQNLAFDLMMFEQNGEPVLVVVNKEI